MTRTIVTVERSDKEPVDLDLPAELPSERLSILIAEALGCENDTAYQIAVAPPGGRVLALDETLAQANAWDGSRILLQVRGAVLVDGPYQDREPRPGHEDGLTWYPLDIDWGSLGAQPLGEPGAQNSDAGSDDSRPGNSGYIWKRVD